MQFSSAMNKGIWAGLVAIAFVAGSITTGTIAYAAPGGVSGNPITSLQAQLDAFGLQLGTFETTFLDRLASVELRIPVLQQQIDDEEASRLAADNVLQQQIEAEAAARAAADSVLLAEVEAEVEAEAAARAAADDVLEVEIEQVQLNLQAEAAATQAADDQLQLNILNEAAARQAADTVLQSNINAEAAARLAADSQLQTRVNGVCPIGSSIRQINPNGSVLCELDDVGAAGALSLYVKRDFTTCPAGSPGVCSATVDCDDNDIAISGGFFLDNNALERSLRVGKDFPLGLPQPSGWAVEYVNEHPTTDMVMFAYAVCNSVP